MQAVTVAFVVAVDFFVASPSPFGWMQLEKEKRFCDILIFTFVDELNQFVVVQVVALVVRVVIAAFVAPISWIIVAEWVGFEWLGLEWLLVDDDDDMHTFMNCIHCVQGLHM